MRQILREPEKLTSEKFDLIVIGGGIYGVMISLISAQRGLKALLLEKDDFGGATSYNHLRIIHGGLRYLQKLDLHRFFESVSERRWFFQKFPEYIDPLACLMPLYGKGVYRPSIFRGALLLNDLLSINRNKGVDMKRRLENGRVVGPKEVEKMFPGVDKEGLKGGAVWYDGSAPDTQRVLIEILKWADSLSSSSLNYMEASELIKDEKSVIGVKAFDRIKRRYFNFHSDKVINAAGPWCRELSEAFDKDNEDLFKPSMAYNVLFDVEAPSGHALAVSPKKENGQTYFLRPWKGRLLAGTIHEKWSGIEKNPFPSEESINNFIDDLNMTISELNLTKENILHIYSGLLPAREEGTNKLAVREEIFDHSENGGPKGLFTVSGVKFTTARLVAEKVIDKVYPDKNEKVYHLEPENNPDPNLGVFGFNWTPDNGNEEKMMNSLKKIIETESVQHLDDLIFRRTTLGDNLVNAVKIAPKLCGLFEWDDKKCLEEVERVKIYYKNFRRND